MEIAQGHLSYCTNIHAAETWPETFAQLQAHIPPIKAQLCPTQPFGIGLRLSNQAADDLLTADNLQTFQQWLTDTGCYVFTVNAFPYGVFHGQPVKQNVYLPDWRQQERCAYTEKVANILAALLPEGVDGSISTVPGAFKPLANTNAQQQQIADHLLSQVELLHELKHTTGKTIRLAIEPEPACLLETSADVVHFYEHYLFTPSAYGELASKLNIDTETAQTLTHFYLGVCLDTCHAAVMFETPLDFAQTMLRHNISITKVQITNALKVRHTAAQCEETVNYLSEFIDATYLHQTSIQIGNEAPKFFVDLPEAMEFAEQLSEQQATMNMEWRVHFHVPTFLETLSHCTTTQADLITFLQQQKTQAVCNHFEVETYTFGVLPPSYQHQGMTENIVRELRWAQEQLQ